MFSTRRFDQGVRSTERARWGKDGALQSHTHTEPLKQSSPQMKYHEKSLDHVIQDVFHRMVL